MLNVLFFLVGGHYYMASISAYYICVYLSYEEKKTSQGQVNVPECFQNPTKSIYIYICDP